MKTFMTLAFFILTLGAGPAASAEESKVASRIVSVGLFKNGFATIQRLVEVPGEGTYVMEEVPKPVHGTFFIESDALVETRLSERAVKEPYLAGPEQDLQETLAGKDVVIHFTNGDLPPVSGRVLRCAREKDSPAGASFSSSYRPYSSLFSGYSPYISSLPATNASTSNRSFLVIKTDAGQTFIKPSTIAYLNVLGEDVEVTRRKHVMVFDVQKCSGKPAKILLTYLTKGISWAPSYLLDISEEKTLTIEQKTVILNELEPMAAAEFFLISGFPNIEFSHVPSPLSAGTTWASFFQALNRRPGSYNNWGGQVVSQQSIMSNTASPASMDFDFSAATAGEGVDLHYQNIGKRSLAEKEALMLSVAKERAEYERIVEWKIPDTRMWNGQFVSEYERRNNPDKYDDAPWDAVRFKNPFSFPMTTAPASIVCKGRFNGQRTSTWVNAGEQTTVRITKALSIRTLSTEQEEKDTREFVYVGGHSYRKTKVKGTLRISNHRKEEVKLVVNRQFSGELIQADDSPRCELREEGVYSVNQRNELHWTLPLKPGEEKVLEYTYNVLVRN